MQGTAPLGSGTNRRFEMAQKCPECGYVMRFVKDLTPGGKKLYECQDNTCKHYKKAGWRFQVSA